MKQFFIEGFILSLKVFWHVFKLAFPLLIIIKYLEDNYQFIGIVGHYLSPVMNLLNLPGETGIVWAAAIFLQLYGAIIVLIGLWDTLSLSVAQVSVLALLMLVAHNLVIEVRIAQRAGMNSIFAVSIRLICGFLFAFICAQTYQLGGWLQEPAQFTISLVHPPVAWMPWFVYQIEIWLAIFLIIMVLVYFMEILKATHLEKYMIRLLKPLLSRIGIGEEATITTIIGMTLGIAYGGGLIIEQSKNNVIPPRDLVCALTFLGLTHSIIEDTLLMLFIGADLSAILFGRLILTLIFMGFFAYWVKQLSPERFKALLLIKSKSADID